MNRRDVMKQFSLAAAAAWLPGSVQLPGAGG